MLTCRFIMKDLYGYPVCVIEVTDFCALQTFTDGHYCEHFIDLLAIVNLVYSPYTHFI